MPLHSAPTPARPWRFVLAAGLATALAGIAPLATKAGTGAWVGTWAASPEATWGPDFALPTKVPAALRDQTLRQVVRVSIGGQRLRLVLSNAYGAAALRVGSVHVALSGGGTRTVPFSDRTVTFGGLGRASVPPGAPLVSDPVDLPVASLTSLAVSIYLPDPTPVTTFHWDGRQTASIGRGDLAAAGGFVPDATTDARIALTGVLVDAPANGGAVVAFGDSITDGNGATTDADQRWPDFLAERLAPRRVAVLNAGISGARVLGDKMGSNAAARFGRDVVGQPGVRAVVVLMGINDIAWPGTAFAPGASPPTADEVIAGYRQLIAQARSHGVRILGATLMPFEGALGGTPLEGYYDLGKEALRKQINAWMRSGAEFDAVIDFDALMRDPQHPTRLRADYDSGDHLHPGDAGSKAMADAVDLASLLGE